MIAKTYACINLDDEERFLSSSVGAYPLLAHEVLKQEGVIFAACFDDKLDVVHKDIINEEDITASQGSNYVSFRLGDTFKLVIDSIMSGKLILFIDTPCQCARLISFLQENNISKGKVLIVDFVCHGVAWICACNGYKKFMKKVGNTLKSVNIRDKSSGWSRGNYSWSETTITSEMIVPPRREVTYMKGMLANICLHPSFYECYFKDVERKTDLTLRDYWEIWSHNTDMNDNKGTSLLLIHSEEEKQIFELVKNSIKLADANIEKAIEGNACIVQSTSHNAKRNYFFKGLNQCEDFISLINDLIKHFLVERMKRMLKAGIKKINKLLEVANSRTINFSVEATV